MYSKATKEQAREWLQQRAQQPQPLPDNATIRRQLGWHLVQASAREKEAGPAWQSR